MKKDVKMRDEAQAHANDSENIICHSDDPEL